MAAAIKIVALSGSIRKASNNTGLIRAAIELTKNVVEGVEIENVDISNLPLLNTYLEKEGTYPAEIEAFRQKIVAADAFLFASPDYNNSDYNNSLFALKNAIAWASRPPNVWTGKPAAIVNGGGGHGSAKLHYHLRQHGVFLDDHFLNVFLPPAKFNSDGDLIDEGAKNNLKAVLLSLKAFTLKLQGKN
ncbi:NADPH:quinone oxidoreductase-like [Vicia villosa]|uniref:NADPH:quinone oxidoreductase-like n=1 Tax=Vicia villosa TaxID=3911 RepID=UPI00273B4499|nr:NADPH:quinone oxidoreductase-like [Vicia villosa]